MKEDGWCCMCGNGTESGKTLCEKCAQKSPMKVVIDFKLLKRIAEYYEFPITVFFGDIKLFKNATTRNKVQQRKCEAFDSITEIIDKYDEDDKYEHNN